MPRPLNTLTPPPPPTPVPTVAKKAEAPLPPLVKESTLYPAGITPPPPQQVFSPERPRLIPPTPNTSRTSFQAKRPQATPTESSSPRERPTPTELHFIAAMATFRNIGDQIIDSLSDRLDIFKNRLQQLSAASFQKVKEAAERAEEVGFWALLKKVATCLVAALSIFVGGALFATGASPLIAGAMIASGILSIANFTFSEAGIWDWIAKKLASEDTEMRNRIALLLPSIVGLSSALIGIFGVAGVTWMTGVQWLDKGIFIAQAALATFQGVTTIGKGFADSRLTQAKAEASQAHAQVTVRQEEVDSSTEHLGHFLETLSHMQQNATHFVQLALKSNEMVAREIHS